METWQTGIQKSVAGPSGISNSSRSDVADVVCFASSLLRRRRFSAKPRGTAEFKRPSL